MRFFQSPRSLIMVLLPAGLVAWPLLDWWIAVPEGTQSHYVGRDTCLTCHATEGEKWTGSDHDLAMDPATPEFVLGDFDDTELEHHGVTSKMERRGDDFFVRTEGPDGAEAEFQVRYVFGVRPLQQYLAELDRGKLQVLPVTWDTEEKRWYFANPDAPHGPDDPLHWTGSAQNWNHMCADCHSTNFAKNFDLKTFTHHPSWSEMDVSCEACHGPGSLHVELASSKSLFWDRHHGYGLPNLKSSSSRPELETCAPCHSRRRPIKPGFRPGESFLDHYSLALLDEGLYHPDGQIDDEVYVYGSFTQSRMYREGVRCTDCHDPHTTRLKFEGNKLCTQCHVAAKYDGEVHHRHKPDSSGALCVECHMPTKNYMVVDPRRDHSLRIPRPDLTVSLGTPNACNRCHTKEEETAEWAAAKVVEWYGEKRRDDPHYGEIIAAGRRGEPSAHDELVRLSRTSKVGPIVRATAVSLLATRYPISRTRDAIERALKHRDALVRGAAVQAFGNWPVQTQQDAADIRSLLTPTFTDRRRLVRTEAARVALMLPPNLFRPEDAEPLQRAIDEYEDSLALNADQAGAHLNLGVLYTNLGRVPEAMQAYRTAIRLDPAVAGPRSNLAALLDERGDAEQARKLRVREAELLARDADLLPDNAILRYRLGLVQYVLGREQEAEAAMKQAVTLEPESTEFLMALALLYEKQQRWPEATKAARDLVQLAPSNRMFRQILSNIERASGAAGGANAPPGQGSR